MASQKFYYRFRFTVVYLKLESRTVTTFQRCFRWIRTFLV